MISQLDIYIEKILNPKILVVKDCSFYNPEIVVTKAKLDLQYPNSSNYVNIPVGKNFSYIINSNTIGLTNVTNSDALSDLPDGIWTIKYSICPNDELYVEYTFLRNIKQLIKYYNLFCKIEIDKCNKKQYLEDLKKIREIKDLIDAAQYLADDCGKYEKSIELYNEAEEMLNEFTNDCKCGK
jgi:hypothetical protein